MKTNLFIFLCLIFLIGYTIQEIKNEQDFKIFIEKNKMDSKFDKRNLEFLDVYDRNRFILTSILYTLIAFLIWNIISLIISFRKKEIWIRNPFPELKLLENEH
jgi:hypothetical protein